MNPLRILLLASSLCLLPLGLAYAGDEPPPGPDEPAAGPARAVVVQALDARDLIEHAPSFLELARAKAKALGLAGIEARDGLLVVSGNAEALRRLARWLAEQRSELETRRHAVEQGQAAIERAREALARAEAARAREVGRVSEWVVESPAGLDARKAHEAIAQGKQDIDNARKELERLQHALAEAKAGGRSLQELANLHTRLEEVQRFHAELVEQQSGRERWLADLAGRYLVTRRKGMGDAYGVDLHGRPALNQWALFATGSDPETQKLKQRLELLRKLHGLLLQLGDSEQAERSERQIHEAEQALKAREDRRAAELSAVALKRWTAKVQEQAPASSDAAILAEVRALRREVKELKELLIKHLAR